MTSNFPLKVLSKVSVLIYQGGNSVSEGFDTKYEMMLCVNKKISVNNIDKIK